MATKISWTDETWNPVVGCTKVSEGCKNCYAEKMAARLWRMGRGDYGSVLGIEDYKWNGKVLCRESFLDKPLHWRKPRKVFVCSMGDLFLAPFEFIDKVFAVMVFCPQHIFQILTKHPDRMRDYFAFDGQPDFRRVAVWGAMNKVEPATNQIACAIAIRSRKQVGWPLKNLWLGVSVENQKRADERIPVLLQIPAAVRFVSIEPMLGAVDLKWYLAYPSQKCSSHIRNEPSPKGLDQVIIGCESINGKVGRLGDFKNEEEWLAAAIDLVNQCKAAEVPVFVKQIPSLDGKLVKKIEQFPKELQFQEYPERTVSNE